LILIDLIKIDLIKKTKPTFELHGAHGLLGAGFVLATCAMNFCSSEAKATCEK
jgi:hypothetical protein